VSVERGIPEPSQITVGVARPVAADEPVPADIDNLMSLLAQEVQRRRHEHLVALVVQLRYGLDMPVKTLARGTSSSMKPAEASNSSPPNHRGLASRRPATVSRQE